MELTAFAPGIYPRSEALVQATRDLDRGRTTAEAVDEQFRRDLEELVRVQESAGLDPLADGMLRWQDLFRPLAEATRGLEARPLTRFLDTNTFYRAVLVEHEPELEEPLAPPALPARRWLGTLPSPFAFARASNDAVNATTLAERVLAPQIESWAAAGCALVVLAEPFLPRDPEHAPELREALERLPRPTRLAVQFTFGDAAPLLAGAAALPVDAVGVDFYATAADAVPDGFPKQLLAGVVDARSSALEDPLELRRFAEELGRRAPAVALVPNGDLQFVPEPIAREKLTRLGRARAPEQAAA